MLLSAKHTSIGLGVFLILSGTLHGILVVLLVVKRLQSSY